MDPKNASSPARRIKNIGKPYVSSDKSWSIVEMDWLHESGQWNPAIGCRWNGDYYDSDSIGQPSSHGYGTWFILPQPFKELAAKLIEERGEEEK